MTTRSKGQVAIAATVALLGFLLAIQLRAQRGLTERLGLEREADLGRILTELTTRNDRLQDEILELRLRLAQRAGTEAEERALIEEARAQIEALRILLGVVPATGRGIVVTIEDPFGSIGPDVLLDAVQELRDAGAEAIEVDGIRTVAQTAFGGVDGAIRVDGKPIEAPYRIVAIGVPSTLAEALRIPGGVADVVAARERASIRISERSSVTITSVTDARTPQHARPRPRR